MRTTLRQLITISLAVGLVFLPFLAKADGGIIYPVHQYVNETGQKALIYYQNQTENLVIAANFKGNSNDFYWIVPVPNKPTISKSDKSLFTTLNKITIIEGTSGGRIYNTLSAGLGSSPTTEPVTVIEQNTVGIYDTTILQATDENALAKWLTDHNYPFPTDQNAQLKIYVDQGWYFVIAKIQNALAGNTEIQNELSTGSLAPLRLTFTANQIIYPMMLTKIALLNNIANVKTMSDASDTAKYYSAEMPIDLYVLADHRTTTDKLDTTWANWVTTTQLSDLNNAVAGDHWIDTSKKLFLTILSGYVSIDDVTGDFTITTAASDSIYPTPSHITGNFWIDNLAVLAISALIIVLSPIGLLFIIAWLIQRHTKRRWLYRLCLAYEILATAVVFIFWLMILLFQGESLSAIFSLDGFLGYSLTSVAAAILGVIFIRKIIKSHANKIEITPTK